MCGGRGSARLSFNFVLHAGDECVDGHGADVVTAAQRNGNGVLLRFPVAQNEQIGNLHSARLADFEADFLVAQVDFRADSGALKRLLKRAGGVVGASVMVMIFACTGLSHSGNAPEKCSVRMPMKRSMEPNTTR